MRRLFLLSFSFVILLCFYSVSLADNHPKRTLNHTAHEGKPVHGSMAGGFELAYHLLTKADFLKLAISEPPSWARTDDTDEYTHFIVLYVTGHPGHSSNGTSAGFQIIAPDGKKMASKATKVGHGLATGVNMALDGIYKIRISIANGTNKAFDSFSYTTN